MLHRAHFAPHILIVTLLTTATVIPSRPASAQDKQSKAEQAKSEKAARVHFQTAEKAFNLGKFDEALKSYEQAYEAKNLSGFLFNIAQCHRNLANPERALFFYQRYLALEPSSPNRALVEELIAEQQAKLDAKKKAEAEAAKPREPEPAAKPDFSKPPESFKPVAAAPPPPPRKEEPAATPVYKRWWFWAGAAAVVGGVAAALLITKDAPAPMGSLKTIDTTAP